MIIMGSKRHNMMMKSAVIVGLIMFFSGSLWCQRISDAFCDEVGQAVIQRLKSSKIDRSEVYEDECYFEFVIEDKIDASLFVEKYKTQTESINSFVSERSMYCFDDDDAISKSCEQSEKVVGWDDSFIHKSNTNNLLLLRRNRFVLTMFSFRFDYLIQMEQHLRKVF